SYDADEGAGPMVDESAGRPEGCRVVSVVDHHVAVAKAVEARAAGVVDRVHERRQLESYLAGRASQRAAGGCSRQAVGHLELRTAAEGRRHVGNGDDPLL